jgi:hypothetical protein
VATLLEEELHMSRGGERRCRSGGGRCGGVLCDTTVLQLVDGEERVHLQNGSVVRRPLTLQYLKLAVNTLHVPSLSRHQTPARAKSHLPKAHGSRPRVS